MEHSIRGFTRAELWGEQELPQWLQDAETIYGAFIRISAMQLPRERTIFLTRFERGWRLVLQNLEHSTEPCNVELWLTPEGMESIVLLVSMLRDQPIDPERQFPALEAMLDTLEQQHKQT